MPTIRSPRRGSMQFWPRKRAKKAYARVRSWAGVKEQKLLGFVGYKVGMTHIMAVNENKNSHLKGEEMAVPVTLIECPPIRLLSARFYKKKNVAFFIAKEIFFKTEKELQRKITPAKENKVELEKLNPEEYERITVVVYSQPKKTGFGKKKPEVVEMRIGGSKLEQLEFIKQNCEKEIPFESVFQKDQYVDIHGVSKGKGTQGPVKRFGIGLKPAKSEKGRRTPGSLGPWCRQQHISWRVAHAGQMGFFQRIEYNKQILEISDEVEKYGKDIHKYGNIKSTFIVIHGSIIGPKKRIIIMTTPIREKSKKHKLVPQ